MLRMLAPETTRLELSDGEWVLVKKRLNAGEHRRMLERAADIVDGRAVVNPLRIGQAMLLAYLVDSSLTDPDGKPFAIRNQPEEVVLSALNLLPSESQIELQDAIAAHVERVRDELDSQKKITSGSNAPAPTYASVS